MEALESRSSPNQLHRPSLLFVDLIAPWELFLSEKLVSSSLVCDALQPTHLSETLQVLRIFFSISISHLNKDADTHDLTKMVSRSVLCPARPSAALDWLRWRLSTMLHLVFPRRVEIADQCTLNRLEIAIQICNTASDHSRRPSLSSKFVFITEWFLS